MDMIKTYFLVFTVGMMSTLSHNAAFAADVFPSDLPDCMFKAIPQNTFESLCGDIDDSLPIAHFKSWGKLNASIVELLEPSVGRITWDHDAWDRMESIGGGTYIKPGNGFCTGTMVSKNLMLTNAHCFNINERLCPTLHPSEIENCKNFRNPYKKINGKKIPLKPAAVAQLMHVVFNFQITNNQAEGESAKSGEAFEIDKLVEIGPVVSPDFAIIKLKPNSEGQHAGAKNKYGFKKFANTPLKTCEQSAVIHHPKGKPKRVSTGKVSTIGDKLFYNDLDTQKGSSGAPIFNMTGDIAGIHYLGGCNQLQLQDRGLNSGEAIQAVINASKILGEL